MEYVRRSSFAAAFCALFVSFFLLAPNLLLAAMPDAIATPAVIDGKGKARDILRFTVSITNTTKHLVTIYPWVTDFDPSAGALGVNDLSGSTGKPLAESLARWIEITRGSIDILPGEYKEVPLTVQLNLAAKPGVYHAVIHLSQGSDRASAEANLSATQDIPVNIEVQEDINERLQLATFAPQKNIFSSKSASFDYRIENIGNRSEVPRGKIRIFDRDGREVATIDANQNGDRLEPSASTLLSTVWASGDNFGRYKAMLDIEYGSRGTLQDTVFFWVMPWGRLVSMFLTLMLACVIIAIIFQSRLSAQPGYATEGSFLVKIGGVLSRFRRAKRNDEEFVEEEEVPHRGVHMMREVVAPTPIRSRLPVSEPLHHEGTRIVAPTKSQPSPRHRVTLEKREKHVPPHHVVNLRK